MNKLCKFICGNFNFRMRWVSLFWLPFVAGCRMTKFVQEEGVALQNHVIKTITAAAPVKCRGDCMDEPLCFSINVRKLPTGRVTCELNNSSKTADPHDFITSAGAQYHQMAVSLLPLLFLRVCFRFTKRKTSYILRKKILVRSCGTI